MTERPLPSNGRMGKVVLVGAGPGDPELLTLKAVRHLNRADIVLADRLVNSAILLIHAPQAQVIYVGKDGRSGKSTAQSDINKLMVAYASRQLYVVRLKGGDSGIFSNIQDELDTLVQHHIPFECVPGISAAQGVSAALGMPLTARGLSRGIRLLTCYRMDIFSENEWINLAATDDTLIFYMSGSTCFELAARLIAAGKKPSTPILLAENATSLQERYRHSTLEACEQDWKSLPIASPALLILGEVAGLIQYQTYPVSNQVNPLSNLENDQPRPAEKDFFPLYTIQDKWN